MFGTIFLLILFISIIGLFISIFTEDKGAYFLGGICLLVAYFILYGILKLLGWDGLIHLMVLRQ